jgi:hypothetical protein
MPLIKDLISIPEQVNKGDFVLNLVDGVLHPEQTAQSYVVTPQLADAFGNALTFLKSVFASPGGKSKAAYLHGSFGTGKSHFMAILNLLLEHHPAVKYLPRLQPVVQSHAWAADKKFLLVPLHMLNRESMEEGILGGYAEFIRRKRPEAPLPAFYRSQEILSNAKDLRKSMGDEAFFSKLNSGSKKEGEEAGGWGAWGSQWSAETFGHALGQPPLDDDRRRLVSDIIQHHLPSLRSQGEYVPLDEGLVALSLHAKELGYDGVILFLDELVLWLMSRAADQAFVSRESPKLAALVEGKIAHAKIPIVSFIARQRDLREALGENLTGANQQNATTVINWWEDRFHLIVLEDRNLPVIAQERLLKPLSPEAKQLIDAAFDRTAVNRKEVMETLLTAGGTREQFRDLYPFSPALIQVLVAVSSALQRERTALRILLQILCTYRDRLELGQVVPVGDLWDIIAAGEEVFSPSMRKAMDDAKRLWRDTLTPLILEELKLPLDFDPASPAGKAHTMWSAFNQRARVAKTLLLGSIVPGVESLRNLNVRRLAALNHGAISTPIPNGEARTVLGWLRAWQPHCGQIKLNGDPNDPIISLEMSDVDTDAIIRQVLSEDNDGNRKRLIMQLLFGEMKIPLEAQGKINLIHTVEWRGTQREVEIRYQNVRESNWENLKAPSDKWVVVLDFPFDEPGKTPRDDIANLQDMLRRQPKGSKTLAWLPNHLSTQALKDLGNLVIINYLLTGKDTPRLDSYTGHLNANKKAEAKSQLTTRKSALEGKLRIALEVAYGVSTAIPTAIVKTLDGPVDQIVSLDQGFSPQNTDKSTLAEALVALIHQALEYQFPLHPLFTIPVKRPLLKRIADYVTDAMNDPRQRTERVESVHREIMSGIAEPLELGTANGNVFHFKRTWVEHFQRCMAQEQNQKPTVNDLRDWCDRPQPRGLSREVADLVIWTFARQTDRRFFYNNAPEDPSWDQLDSTMDLREQTLPDENVWLLAQDRAAQVFGYPPDRLRNSATVAKLTAAIRTWERDRCSIAADLATVLNSMATTLGQIDHQAPRLKTAQVACDLLNAAHRAPDEQVVTIFAQTPVSVDLAVVAKSIESAKAVSDAARLTGWHDLIDLAGNGSAVAERAAAGLAQIRDAMSRDQRDLALESVITDLSAAARMLRMEYELGLKKIDPEAVKRKQDEERKRQDDERQRQKESDRLRQEADRQRIEQEQIEATKHQQREEAARLQREKDTIAEVERRRKESGEPVVIKASDGKRGIEVATAQMSTRLEDLQKAYPGKQLRITIDILDS